MAEDFDIGPLTWVKDEIDQALKSVLENLSAVSANHAEVSSLRFSQTHLFQVSGALDMVGLEGCKRFCVEIEKLAAKLEKHQLPLTSSTLEALVSAVNSLSAYLQDLLNGAPDQPLRLFPSLQALQTLQGETAEESELFFPDTSLRAPKDLPVSEMDEKDIPDYLAQQRRVFQKALLDWLQNSSETGQMRMREAMENVLRLQQQTFQRTFWWVVTAFVDILKQPKSATNTGVKKLCRRIDQQLRSLNDGNNRATGNLLRDLLYYIAVADPETDTVTRVKQVFKLENYLPSSPTQPTFIKIDAAELELVRKLAQLVEALEEAWTVYSELKSPELLLQFSQQLQGGFNLPQPLQYSSLNELMAALRELGEQLASADRPANDAALIEVAAGLTLLEDAFKAYQHLSEDLIHRQTLQAQRLRDIAAGQGFAPREVEAQLTANDALSAVAQQIKNALYIAEQTLDTFFRDPDRRDQLVAAEQPLAQIVAAFDILDMPVPIAIAEICGRLVRYFREPKAAPDPQLFETVAESLSMLGFYVEELPRIRPESQVALEQALARLQTADAGIHNAPALSQSSIPEPAAGYDVPPVPVEIRTDRAADQELRDIFLEEAEEVLAKIAQDHQALRVNATDKEALAGIRRGFHTLKGSGRTIGLTALGEVAWALEKLLNLVIDRNVVPSPAQLTFVEEVSAAFADWVETLRQAGEVAVDETSWISRAATLEAETGTQKLAAGAEEVVIGGTRKLSKSLFNIFLVEAEQHMHTLREWQQSLQEEVVAKPSEASRRAAHTLASNAGTAGFKAICDLARELEYWLDVHSGDWTPQDIRLSSNVVTALADMLRKAGQLRQPRQNNSLLAALRGASAVASIAPAEEIGTEETLLAESPASANAAQVEEGREGQGEGQPAGQEVPAMASEESPIAEAIPETQVAELLLATEPPAAEGLTHAIPGVEHELFTMFLEEAHELVPRIGNELRAWRHQPDNAEHPDELQRALHTLKGSARMAAQMVLADTVHDMEDGIIRALKKKTEIDFDHLFADLDRIGTLLEEAAGSSAGAAVPVEGRPIRSSERNSQYLRLRADVLDRLINEAGEISIARSRMERQMQAFKQYSLDLTESVFRLRNQLREMEIEAESQLQSRMEQLQEVNETFDPLEFDRFTRLQELTRMMAESVNDVATIQHGLLMNMDETESAMQQQSRMNRELQHGLMDVRMVPFSMIAERLQRIVRQTARELDKRVEMTIDGGDVNIDRSVLDRIGAPLEHLLRNAVAHGLETPERRQASGKPETGRILLKVGRENDEITITVSDDGSGINLAKVRQKALVQQLFTEGQAISEQALMSLIFEPGFSTAVDVTQIAGRGVGLDSVRSDISSLGGRIDVRNAEGYGAVFNVYLPVTLSVSQVVLVRSGVQVFALPAVMVEQVQKLKPEVLAEAYARQQLAWNERIYPFHYLSRLVGDEEQQPEEQRYTPVILLRSGSYHIAVHVDDILGNHEVVMKPIGPQLIRVPGMMGATVMGDGNIVLIINPVQLANREVLAVGSIKVSNVAAAPVAYIPEIMVVDDSLTMRKVLSRLLEREGYRVSVAKDGMDALQLLQESLPDIILSDIEMPRMDGFELVRNIRGDSRTAHIPLVIISSRTAEKHQSFARELGVNAYLGKPVQDEELIAQVADLLGERSERTTVSA